MPAQPAVPPKVPPAVSAYMAQMQARSAASLKGTERARERAAKAGRSLTPEGIKARTAKAVATRMARAAERKRLA